VPAPKASNSLLKFANYKKAEAKKDAAKDDGAKKRCLNRQGADLGVKAPELMGYCFFGVREE